MIYILQTSYFKQFELFKLAGIGKQLISRMVEIIRLGFPMGIQFGAEIAAFSVTTFLIGRFGVNSLVAAQIAQQVIVLALTIPFTMSEATAILVGQSVGNNDRTAIRSYGFSSQTLVTLFLLVASTLYFICPQLLIGIYVNISDPKMTDVVSLSALFLYVAAISQLFDGMRNITAGALRALNDSKYPMYTGIFIMWCIGLPIGALLAFWENLGPIGFPLGAAIAFFVGAVILSVRFNKKTKNADNVYAVEQAG